MNGILADEMGLGKTVQCIYIYIFSFLLMAKQLEVISLFLMKRKIINYCYFCITWRYLFNCSPHVQGRNWTLPCLCPSFYSSQLDVRTYTVYPESTNSNLISILLQHVIFLPLSIFRFLQYYFMEIKKREKNCF